MLARPSMTAARKLETSPDGRSGALRRHARSIQPDSPMASVFLAAAERHRAKGHDPVLVAALVRAAWRELVA